MSVVSLLVLLLFTSFCVATNTTQCVQDLADMMAFQYINKTVSTEMILSSGLTPGNYGNYDQCQETGKDIAQYCFIQGDAIFGKVPMGLCVPSSCSESALQNFSLTLLTALNISSVAVYCNDQHPAPSLNTGGITCVVVILVLAAIALVGSVLDYLKQQRALIIRSDLSLNEAITDTEYDPLMHEDQVTRPKESPKWIEVFICFSIQSNLSFLLNDKSSSSPLGVLNGLRVLMMFWVILGHTMFLQVLIGYDNMGHLANQYNNSWAFQFIYSAEYAVDVFFFLSAFLVVYLTYKEMKTGKAIPWVYYYVHRYWRLTPVYMFVLFIYFKMLPGAGRGPLWFLYDSFNVTACDKYWWTNLLYVNNFHPWIYGDSCMSWSWFLANDLQFFCCVPIILLSHKLSKKLSWAIMIVLIGTCAGLNGWLLDTNFAKGSTAWNNATYNRPYTRMGPYVIGIASALLVLDCPNRIKNFARIKIARWGGYIISSIIALVCTYATYQQDKWNKIDYIVFQMFSRDAYVFSIAIFVLLCVAGFGGVPKWLLSAGFWAPLAKLTYCAYLVHPAVMLFFMFQETRSAHYAWTELSLNFVGYTCLSYALALVCHLLVEKPCSNIERLVLKKKGH